MGATGVWVVLLGVVCGRWCEGARRAMRWRVARAWRDTALMGDEATPGRSLAPSEVMVTITVLGPERGRALRDRVAGGRGHHRARRVLLFGLALVALGTTIAIGLALVALGTTIAIGRHSSRSARPVGPPPRARVLDSDRAAIAAAFGYPYPPRCLTITIAAGAPDYARANVDRARGCGRFHGYLNASFHRVDGTWRLVLDEGQRFVPNNSLLVPCHPGRSACAGPRNSGV